MKLKRIFSNILQVFGLLLLVVIIVISPAVIGFMFILHNITDVDGRERIEIHFSGVISRNHVEKYKFRVVGIGDTFDYWELKNINKVAGDLIIQNFNLKPKAINHDLHSLSNPPRWWPKSRNQFYIYETYDYSLGSTELWMPKEGSTAYLFEFLE